MRDNVYNKKKPPKRGVDPNGSILQAADCKKNPLTNGYKQSHFCHKLM
jgi:hypothetical protein